MPGEPPRVQPSKKVAEHWDDDGNRVEGTVRTTSPATTPATLWAAYLDFYRRTVADGGRSRLPESERRAEPAAVGLVADRAAQSTCCTWSSAGSCGASSARTSTTRGATGTIDDPWTTGASDGRWQVPDDVTAEALAERLAARSAGVRRRSWPRTGSTSSRRRSPRFDDDPPTLEWICFHVLQEYARHAGHLDIAVELAARTTRLRRQLRDSPEITPGLISRPAQIPVTPSPPRLLVEALVLEQVQHGDADLAAGLGGPVDVEELRDDVAAGSG